MGQVKNLLRGQSKYGLMGSSGKTGKFYFRGSPEHFLHKSTIWDRTPPHLHIKCSPHVCGRVQGSQIFKWNSIISICSKVMAVLVISWSPSSLHHPCIVPIIPTSSPHHPHSPQKVPMWSPWSVVSTYCPHHPHIVPVIPMSSPHHLEGPHIIPNSQDTHPTHPPLPCRVGGPKSVKMQ